MFKWIEIALDGKKKGGGGASGNNSGTKHHWELRLKLQMGHEQLFFFKYNFFDTLTSLATLLLYSHIAAMAIKMKRTLSSSLTEWFFLRCTQIMVEIRSKIIEGQKKECPKLYGCECDTNLCILWSCFPRFHAALTVCHKWYHLLQSVTSNASAGVQLWSIRAALCRTERRALCPVLPFSRRAAAISTEHQRINWTILQFMSSLWHLVLFCSQQ